MAIPICLKQTYYQNMAPDILSKYKWIARVLYADANVWLPLLDHLWQLYFMIEWCLTLFLTVFQLHHSGQCTYPCFSGVLLTSTPHNILFKPLAAFPQNHRQNNRQQWERNESCRNDYHQSSERILAELGIKPVTSCSQVHNAIYWLSYGAHLRFYLK